MVSVPVSSTCSPVKMSVDRIFMVSSNENTATALKACNGFPGPRGYPDSDGKMIVDAKKAGFRCRHPPLQF